MNKYLTKIASLQENVKEILDSHGEYLNLPDLEGPGWLDQVDEVENQHNVTHARALLGLQGLNVPIDPVQANTVIRNLSSAQRVGLNGPAIIRRLGATATAGTAAVALGRLGYKAFGNPGGIAGLALGGIGGAIAGNKILGHILSNRESARNQDLYDKRENSLYGAYALMADRIHRLGLV